MIRTRSEGRRSHREAVQRACLEFSLTISDMRESAFDLRGDPDNPVYLQYARQANRAARARYENLRLVTSSRFAQEAGRRALRHAFGMQLQARGAPTRADEADPEPQALVQDWLTKLYAEVRRETGVPRADDVYREPDEWLGVGWLDVANLHPVSRRPERPISRGLRRVPLRAWFQDDRSKRSYI